MGFGAQSMQNDLLYFLTTDVAEVFIVYIQLAYYIANQLTIIFIYCQVFAFLSAGLHIFEHIYFRTILVIVIVFWLMFIFTLNNFIFPTSWNFFFKFQEFLSFQNLTFFFEAKLNEYLDFYTSIFYLCNLVYQIIILFFIFLDLFKTNILIVKKLRKIFYFVFLICSTFLTPPEIVYQLMVSICIAIIYELITIFLIFKAEFINIK